MNKDLKKTFKYFVNHTAAFILLLFVVFSSPLHAQTPGLIIQPATGAGKTILDPDGDGYVSAKTNGIQLGFVSPPNNDVTQSEIPYAAIVKPDPVADVLRGGSGNNTEIIGVDAAGNNAVLTYKDATNLFYRFRIDRYSTATLSYSVLIDTDGKFGFTGANADPNAVSGNPGFEIELNLQTNKGVFAYNVDGTTNPVQIVGYTGYSNYQQSYAITYTSGNLDVFYDYYFPFSALSGYINASTPLRYVGITCMNPFPAIGNQAVSDVGGVTSSGSLDNTFIELVNNTVPTVPGAEVLDPSACPVIDAVSPSNTTISGTSTEASGTSISVKVYASNGTTLLGSATTTTSGTAWSVNVSSLSPAVTLANGQIVKAVATAVGKGPSLFSCSTQTVMACSVLPAAPTLLDFSASGIVKVTFTNATVGTKTITVYNSNGSVWGTGTSSSTIQNVVSISTGSPQTANSKVPGGTYYATVSVGGCESTAISGCQTGGVVIPAPVINSPIAIGATTVSGTGVSGNYIRVMVGGTYITGTTVGVSNTWSVTVPALKECQVITATQARVAANGEPGNSQTGGCETVSSAVNVSSRAAVAPTIYPISCSSTSPTSVSGFSAEIGATVTLYRTSPTTATLGTTTVSADGSWTISPLSLTGGDVLNAKVSSSCLTTSSASSSITISTQTSLSGYTIGVTTPTQNATSISGTISGGTYPVTLNVYVDGINVGTGVTINSAGNWTLGSLATTDLYTGGSIKVTLTSGSNCESPLSAELAIVQCNQPTMPSYTAGSQSYCVGSAGSISISSTQTGVVYQLVNGSGVAQGPSQVGNGGTITLYTNALNANLTGLYVKAYNVVNTSCAITSTSVGAIDFDTPSPTPTVTFTSTSLAVSQGTTTLNLPFSAKSSSPSADTYTITYSIGAINQGFANVTTATAIPTAPGNIALTIPSSPAPGTYSGTISIAASSGSSCVSTYGFTVTVYSTSSVPVISSHPVGSSICSGNTASLSVSAAGTITGYQWQSATTYSGTYANVSDGTGGTTASYTTASLSANKYYRVVVTNSSGSTTSNVAVVTVNSAPSAAGTITGSSTVTAGQSSVSYSVPTISGATSYIWSYSGTGVTITGNTNSVFLSFSPTATAGTLTVKGTNSCGDGTVSTGFGVTVSGSNNAPTVAAISKSGPEDTDITFAATDFSSKFTDIDGNSLTKIKVVDLPANGTLKLDGTAITTGQEIVAADLAKITFTPNANWNGSTSFNWNGYDGTTYAASNAAVNITVTAVNDAPTAVNDVVNVDEDVTLTVAAASGVLTNDTDPESDTKTVTAVRLGDTEGSGTAGALGSALTGAYGKLTLNANGSYTYMADNAQALAAGVTVHDYFNYTMWDGTASDIAVIDITITGINDAPTAVNDAGSVDEDATLTVAAASGVLTNDTDPDSGTTKTVTAVRLGNTEGSGTAGALGSALTGAYGKLTLNANGSYTYVADNAQALAAGATAHDYFNYTMWDGTASDIAVIDITITGTNDAPVAVDDSHSIDEDGSVTLLPLTGDSDADGNTLTITSIGGTTLTPGTAQTITVTNGTVTITAGGAITFTPNANFNSTTAISIPYVISDGNGGTATANELITVNAVNDNPVAVNDTHSIDEDGSVTLLPLTGDSDADGNTLTITSIGGTTLTPGTAQTITVTNGTVTITAGGAITFTPNANFNSTTAIIIPYVISDGNGGTATANELITVNAVNDAPTAVNDAGSVVKDATLTVIAASGVLANDTDPDSGATKTVTAVRLGNTEGSGTAGTPGSALSGTYGKLTLNADGSYTYVADNALTLAAGATVHDYFNYTMWDGTDSDIAVIDITITGTNNVPTVANITKSGSEDIDITFAATDFSSKFTDSDGSLTKIQIVNLPANGTLKLNGSTITAGQEIVFADLGKITFTPDANWTGNTSFNWNGSDGTAYAAANASVNITISGVNLSILKTVNNATPNVGDDIIFTLTATNNGPGTATNVVVTDQLAAGYTYKSDDSSATYNSSTGAWTIGTLTNGSSVTIHITVTVKP